MPSLTLQSRFRPQPRSIYLFVATGLLALVQAGSALGQTALDVNGSGFRVEQLATGIKAFSNRAYVWVNVPARFQGWMITQVKGGSAARLAVRARQGGDLFVASVHQPSPAWEAVPGATFGYNDKFGTTLQVFAMHVAPGQIVEVPQDGWAGTLVISPSLFAEDERRRSVTVPVVIGTAAVVAHQVIKHDEHVQHEIAVEKAERKAAKQEVKAEKREMKREIKAERRVEKAQAHRIQKARAVHSGRTVPIRHH